MEFFEHYFKNRYLKKRLPRIDGRKIRKDEVVRIKVIEDPVYERVDLLKLEWDLGEFEWQYNGKKFLVHMDDLKKELVAVGFSGREKEVIDRAINFRKIYLILPTKQVIT